LTACKPPKRNAVAGKRRVKLFLHRGRKFWNLLYSCLDSTNFRLHEFDEQVAAVREGMAKVIPVPLLSLFSGYELETMVCGSPDIPLNLLKSVATYKGKDSQIVMRFKG
jgi:hypothetical protein